MGVCQSRTNDRVIEEGVNKEFSAAHYDEPSSPSAVESAEVSPDTVIIYSADCDAKRQNLDSNPDGTNQELSTETWQSSKKEQATSTLDYDDEVTITYEQFQEDMKPAYSTWAETLFVKLRELTTNKTSLTICDIGCGDGNNCRMVMDRLTELSTKEISIIGIDISSSQIELAKSKTCSVKKEYDGISFEVGSAQSIPYRNTFDVAFSMWPFGYAENVDILQEMMTSCFESLKAGGVCIGVTMTMDDPSTLRQFDSVRKDEFNLVLEYEEPLKDGDHLNQNNGVIKFKEVFYYKATYEKVAKTAGFETVTFLDDKSLCYDRSLSPTARKKAALFMKINPMFSMFVLTKSTIAPVR